MQRKERLLDIDSIIDDIDAVEFLSQFTELEEKNGEWWGLSPLKKENTPSFSVRQETGRFYDFSSGIGGSILTFLMHYYKISYEAACKKIIDYVGGENVADGKHKKLSATIICEKFLRQQASQHKESVGVVLQDDYMDRYEKSPDALAVWESEGISQKSLDEFQVYYDRFSDRLVYPIRNLDGKIVNIGGRTLDPMWKEKKLRKYNYFYKWGRLDTIYGLYENFDEIKKHGEIVIFEGAKSVLLANSWDFRHTGAILTSHLNYFQLNLLIKLGFDVTFALDKDIDIRKDRNIAKLKRFVNVKYLKDTKGVLGDKDSPVDKGEEVFRELYDNKKRLR